jgi:hypothetical protein
MWFRKLLYWVSFCSHISEIKLFKKCGMCKQWSIKHGSLFLIPTGFLGISAFATFSSYHNIKFVSRGGLSVGYAFTPTTHHNRFTPAFFLIAFILILMMNVGKWPRFAPYRKHCVLFCYSHVFMYMHNPIKSMYINSRGKCTFCCEVKDSARNP